MQKASLFDAPFPLWNRFKYLNTVIVCYKVTIVTELLQGCGEAPQWTVDPSYPGSIPGSCLKVSHRY